MENKIFDVKNITNNFPNRIFLVVNYTHQYAEGVTGANHYVLIHVGIDGTGYKNKTEANLSLKGLKYKSKNKPPKKGELGDYYGDAYYFKGFEMKKIIQNIYRSQIQFIFK